MDTEQSLVAVFMPSLGSVLVSSRGPPALQRIRPAVNRCKIPENYVESIPGQRLMDGRRTGLKIRSL